MDSSSTRRYSDCPWCQTSLAGEHQGDCPDAKKEYKVSWTMYVKASSMGEAKSEAMRQLKNNAAKLCDRDDLSCTIEMVVKG